MIDAKDMIYAYGEDDFVKEFEKSKDFQGMLKDYGVETIEELEQQGIDWTEDEDNYEYFLWYIENESQLAKEIYEDEQEYKKDKYGYYGVSERDFY